MIQKQVIVEEDNTIRISEVDETMMLFVYKEKVAYPFSKITRYF